MLSGKAVLNRIAGEATLLKHQHNRDNQKDKA